MALLIKDRTDRLTASYSLHGTTAEDIQIIRYIVEVFGNLVERGSYLSFKDLAKRIKNDYMHTPRVRECVETLERVQ